MAGRHRRGRAGRPVSHRPRLGARRRPRPCIDPLTLVLDPGVVFGAGNHPTTRDCLLAIDRAAAEARFETVLDLGTGTGILALAAARRLGARVAAVDLSPAAVRTAAGNVARNGLAGRVLVALGRAEDAARRSLRISSSPTSRPPCCTG
ncbi:MAG: 50S ribosomal protein L11 methyltransferase [Desulfobacterales bacterium]|nr:50S ribosomal protein L11 methyltransferase [Desulfobacterales bacterium]